MTTAVRHGSEMSVTVMESKTTVCPYHDPNIIQNQTFLVCFAVWGRGGWDWCVTCWTCEDSSHDLVCRQCNYVSLCDIWVAQHNTKSISYFNVDQMALLAKVWLLSSKQCDHSMNTPGVASRMLVSRVSPYATSMRSHAVSSSASVFFMKRSSHCELAFWSQLPPYTL